MLVPAFSPAQSRFGRLAVWTLIITLLIPGGLVHPKKAAAANAIQTILMDALYGGAAGLLLGGVLMLVVDKDSRDDTLRWGAVIGTFAGFAYGVYDSRSGSSSYSDLYLRSLPREIDGAAPRTRNATFAAWADSMKMAQQSGSALAAALVRPPSSPAVGSAARCGYGRKSW